jgi:SPOR domain
VSDELSIPRSPVYRVPRRSGLEPLTRRLMLIAGGLIGALALIVVLYSSAGHHSGTVPVVQADQRPVRVKPANPGGMQIPGLSADTGAGDTSTAADSLAPSPETPDPQALARQKPPPAPAASQVTQTAGPQPPASQSAKLTGPLAPASHPTIAATAPPIPAIAAPPAAVKPTQFAATAMPEHHAVPAAEHGPPGRAQVQLAAVGTENAAREEWHRLAHRMPDVLGAHHPVFSKTEHDGHTLWRLRTGDFATEAQASQFCQLVRAKGGGCAVASF